MFSILLLLASAKSTLTSYLRNEKPPPLILVATIVHSVMNIYIYRERKGVNACVREIEKKKEL